ncbi:hypothetical protein L917_02707 [Phytophthora nicotianae]|uniref:Uncharacterized protein n=1 Tax=Phytophthora nicotianae TaxID=4792 RepID=W2LSX1_PHYNI|nr:hypothetical protein L917_02707 [Phytophthora nicotianae]
MTYDLQAVAGMFSRSIQHTIEENGILSSEPGPESSGVNGFRASLFLAASATGQKLPAVVVFAGVPGARMAADV